MALQLTRGMLRVLRNLELWQENYPPSVRELAGLCDLSKGGVSHVVAELEREGLLKRHRRMARALAISERGRLVLSGELPYRVVRVRGRKAVREEQAGACESPPAPSDGQAAT